MLQHTVPQGAHPHPWPGNVLGPSMTTKLDSVPSAGVTGTASPKGDGQMPIALRVRGCSEPADLHPMRR